MRVVKDINTRTTTEEQRRAYDTFIRPSVDDNDSKRMYQLAETLNRISPVIRNYKEEAEQAYYNAEVARGYAASANFKPDEVPADKFYRYSSVNANEYAKRSRAFQHGVNIHEAEALANTLPTAADEWFRTQKYNGRRIYEIEDPVQFNEAYRQFIQNYIKTESGGTVDPKIYQKYIGGAVNQTEHNVTQQFLSERRRAMETKAIAAYTSSVDSSMLKTFGTAEYRKNRGAWVRTYAADFNAKTKALADEIGDVKAGNAAANIMAASMNGLMSMNELNDMMAVAQANPLVWEDPNNKLQIQRVYTTQKSYIEQEARRREYEARYHKAENERKAREARFNALLDFGQKNPNMSLNEYYDHFRRLGYKAQDILTAYRGASSMRQASNAQILMDYQSGARSLDNLSKDLQDGTITYQQAKSIKENTDEKQNKDINTATNNALVPFKLDDPSQKDQYNLTVLKGALQKEAARAYQAMGGEAGKEKDKDFNKKLNQTVLDYSMHNFPQGRVDEAINDYRMEQEGFKQTNPTSAAHDLVILSQTNESNNAFAIAKTAVDEVLTNYARDLGIWLPYDAQVEQDLLGHGVTSDILRAVDVKNLYQLAAAAKFGRVKRKEKPKNGSRRSQPSVGNSAGNGAQYPDTGNGPADWNGGAR